MSGHEIARLIHEYGLIVVFLAPALQAVGLPVPGGTAIVAAAIDASTRHGLPLAGVIICAAAGALAGTTGGFFLGRWRGEAILLRLGRWARRSPERVQQLRSRFAGDAAVPLFIARFITGLRNVAGLVAGASGMAFGVFVAVSAAAAVAWSALISLEYYFAGKAVLAAPTWLQILLIVVGLVATVVSLRAVSSYTTRGAGPDAETGGSASEGTPAQSSS